jgi:hypothetical protein
MVAKEIVPSLASQYSRDTPTINANVMPFVYRRHVLGPTPAMLIAAGPSNNNDEARTRDKKIGKLTDEHGTDERETKPGFI